ncbi:MAG: hypothetical protein Q7P63_04600 [Verrucomicrobiota bacterium JB022]|nr:hypothetical protein [Verrucomicrobiota bacterium JB022]
MKLLSHIPSSALLPLVAAFAVPVQALSFICDPKTPAEAYEAADAVFFGRVVKTVSVESRPGDWEHTVQYVTLELQASWKAEDQAFENNRVVVRTDGYDYCQPYYGLHDTWLVFGYSSHCDGVDDTGEPCAPYSNSQIDGTVRVASAMTLESKGLQWIESLGAPDSIYGDDLAMAGLHAFPLYREGSEYMAPPFGKFRVNQAPWYKWEGNGWVYIAEFANGGFWWYDQSANRWFFTDESTYPWLYTEGFDWIALDTAATSPNARWAYVTKYDQWMKLSALNAFEAPAAE